MGHRSSQSAAQVFVHALALKRAREAWSLLEPEYRERLAHRWYDQHGSRLRYGSRAQDISEIVSGSGPEWSALYPVILARFERLWKWKPWRWTWTEADVVSPGLELVHLADDTLVEAGRLSAPVRGDAARLIAFFARRHPDGWLICGIDDVPARPMSRG